MWVVNYVIDNIGFIIYDKRACNGLTVRKHKIVCTKHYIRNSYSL